MNPYLQRRLKGLHQMLLGVYEASGHFANANKGTEREAFISLFLSQVLPPIYRFGSGEIIDTVSQLPEKSGQLDVVIEMPWVPSFGLPGAVGVRLYPAEAVGAAIEVKSNVASQWGEVESTAGKLAPLRQTLSGISVAGGGTTHHTITREPIPLFCVGFEGWKEEETVTNHVTVGEVDGILILKPLRFIESDRLMLFRKRRFFREDFDELVSRGETPDKYLRACRRINELKITHKPDKIAQRLNAEGLVCAPVHFGDERKLPQVQAGAWVGQDVTAVIDNISLHTRPYKREAALLAFVARVHAETSKRSAMTFDLMGYDR